jgi:transcriptional regulator with XRE-family HTH domain
MIRAKLIQAGRKRTEFAAAMGMTESTLSRRFNGETEWTITEVINAARFLGVPITDLTPTEES